MGVAIGGTLAGSMGTSGSEFTVSMSSTAYVADGIESNEHESHKSKGGDNVYPSFFLIKNT
jgi:hypothetical protein